MPGVKRARETSDESEERSLSKNNCGYEWVRGSMLGRGGYGSVYLATVKRPKLCPAGTKIPKYMAVKSTWFHKSTELMRENQILDLLKGCPYLVGYYGSDVTAYADRGKFVYNVLLEYADGGALSNYIHLGCSEPQVSRYTEYLLRGIDYIHQFGFVHCDIKPENILMVASDYGYVPKLADFGLAKTVSSESSCRGTLVYMAPETVVSDIQEPPSDIWALGCVVINMLTGKRQWEASPSADLRQLVPLITGESPIPFGISDVATDFLEKCLDRDPVKRFTAAQLLKHPFVTQHREVEEKSVSLLDKYPNFIPLDSLSSVEENESSLLGDYSEIHPVKLMFPWRRSIPASSAASAVLDAA